MRGGKKILLIKNAFPVEQFTLRKSPAIYSKKMPNNFYFENARGFPKKIVNPKGPPRGRPHSSYQLPDIGISGKVFFLMVW